MALLDTAFLAIWHDVAPDQDAEYVRWHTRLVADDDGPGGVTR
jgi:hypothetical protein